MMVDEAHRLKNHESALYQEMTQFSFKNRLLITGQFPQAPPAPALNPCQGIKPRVQITISVPEAGHP